MINFNFLNSNKNEAILIYYVALSAKPLTSTTFEVGVSRVRNFTHFASLFLMSLL